ncbi:MAG: N-acetyl-gamma-glutamyl-phosphate reductase [Armatimonadota bacterium]
MKIGVGILGGTGFGAGELLRLFAGHSNVEVVLVTSRSNDGKHVSSVHPHLASVCDLKFQSSLQADMFKDFEKVCIISALPHGASAASIKEIVEVLPSSKIIDLSGDLRIKDFEVHRKHYDQTFEYRNLRSSAVYGSPEVFREQIRLASLVANPGCLATAANLSLLPFVSHPIRSVHLHLATGSSGAGKDPRATTHHPVRHANFSAYKVLEHQHVPEVIQCLNDAGGTFESIPFVAHSLPISRGILCSAFIDMDMEFGQEEVEAMLKVRYRKHPFIRFKGSTPAEIVNVVGSNFCDISVTVKDKQIVVHAAIDNLVKGMAGQAIQNMNLMFGMAETAGLWFGGLRPV